MADTYIVISDGPVTNIVLGTETTNIVLGGNFDFIAYFAALPEYDSDESAIADGLEVGDIYKTADNHVSLPGGLQKEIRQI